MKRKWYLLGFLFQSVIGLPLAAIAAPNGWYGTFTAGVSSYGNSQNDEKNIESQLAHYGIQSVASVNDNPAGLGLGVGYRFNDYFALEGNYMDLGTATATINVTSPPIFTIKEDIRAKGETLDFLGFIPVSQSVQLFGKLGVFDYSLDETLNSNIPVPLTNNSANGTTYDFGIGVDIRFTGHVGLRAGLTQYYRVGNQNTTGQENIGLAYAQLVFNF
ncbi:MAG: outer membrane beta-barrel protein [Gammaproteobacteria bacterium]